VLTGQLGPSAIMLLNKEMNNEACVWLGIQVQAEQALQNITAAMEQASGHRQEAALLKKQLVDDQVQLQT
jgi:enamine deaminase RidA (YjgF/YER057c/UK114 family)